MMSTGHGWERQQAPYKHGTKDHARAYKSGSIPTFTREVGKFRRPVSPVTLCIVEDIPTIVHQLVTWSDT